MSDLNRILALLLPVTISLVAVAIAGVLVPPEGAQMLDNLGRDLTALLVGLVLGGLAAWALYGGGEGGERG